MSARGKRRPGSGITPVTGWIGRLFEEKDISWLADEVGYPPPENPEKSAMLLDHITRDAIRYIGTKELSSPPSASRDWYKNINETSEKLLAALDFNTSEDALSAYESIVSREAIINLNQDISLIKDDMKKILICMDAQNLLNVQSSHLYGIENTQRDIFLRRIFMALPWMIGALAQISKEASDFYGDMKGEPGNKKNIWREILFSSLREHFKEITGQPMTGLRTADEEGAGTRNVKAPPVFWCQNVFDHMRRRAPEIMMPHAPGLVQELDDLVQLSGASVIESLLRKTNLKGTGDA